MDKGWLRIVTAGLALASGLSAQDYEAPQRSEYSGPAVLSRGQSSSFLAPFETIRLRPFVSLQGLYSSNLTNVSVDSRGALVSESNYGGVVRAGLVGSRRWRKQVLSLGYVGGYSHYPQAQFFNGSDQSLTLQYSAQVSRRVVIGFRQFGGISSRPQFQWGFFQMDPLQYYLPEHELFDNRLFFSTTSGEMTVRLSPRWSTSVGGDYFLNKRRSAALFGTSGSRARGDAVYRLSRTSSVGVAYHFANFRFTKGFGGTDIHSVAVLFSQRVGRDWEFSTQLTGSRLESLGLIRVPVDPAVRAIVGSDSVNEAYYRIQYLPQFGGRISRRIRRGTLSGSINRGVMPGNGVYLTSRLTSVNGFYSHHYSSRLSFTLSGGWDRMDALVQDLRPYGGYTSNGGVSYSLERLVPGLYLVGNVSWMRRHIDRAAGQRFNRDWTTASAGISWSPGEYPLAFW